MKRRFRQPWHDPAVGYRNIPEYQRQRQEAKLSGDEGTVERRWSARWQRKLAMQAARSKAHE